MTLPAIATACERVFAVASLLAAAVTSPPCDLGAQVIAIRAGRVVDPDAGTSATNQVILIERGVITAIGQALDIPKSARVVDLSRATVLPGLVDAHTHLCMEVIPERDGQNYYFTTLMDPNALRAVEGTVNARTMLEAGFTTVRDVGNEGNYACVAVAQMIRRGRIPGPTMLTAGRIIAPYGGQFQLQPDKRTLAEPEYFFADSHDEMQKGVRENAHFGATVIKIVVDDQRYIYSTENIRFIKDEAARAGLKLAAHAWTRDGAHNAAEAGVASIEHGIDMTDDDLALAKRNGVALVGTEFIALADTGAFQRTVLDRLRRADKIGVTLVYGTDAINFVPGKTRGEVAISGIDAWTKAGMSPATILRAMTVNATRLLGVEKRRGTLKPGMAADLIATLEDPLSSIATLKRPVFVMKDGVIVRQVP